MKILIATDSLNGTFECPEHEWVGEKDDLRGIMAGTLPMTCRKCGEFTHVRLETADGRPAKITKKKNSEGGPT